MRAFQAGHLGRFPGLRSAVEIPIAEAMPVFRRSKFIRLADLQPPYGGKIARLEKMTRLMS